MTNDYISMFSLFSSLSFFLVCHNILITRMKNYFFISVKICECAKLIALI